MPKSDAEVGRLIRTLGSNYQFAGVTVEKVWAGGKNTGTGKATMGVSSAFKFGANFGAICAALSCAGLKYELVAPVSWKPKMGLPKGATKKDSLGTARELFPNAELTQRNSEAWLLAEYGRRWFNSLWPVAQLKPNSLTRLGRGPEAFPHGLRTLICPLDVPHTELKRRLRENPKFRRGPRVRWWDPYFPTDISRRRETSFPPDTPG